ncbi:MAG: GerMN domain-containing protein [Candidatus Krumholzibacteriia bacterium]
MNRRVILTRALAIGALLVTLAGCGEEQAPAPLPQEQVDSWEGYGSQTVLLFFAEGGVEPEWREELRVIELADDPVDRIARTLRELLRGPERGLGRAFPPGMELQHLFLEERPGLLTLDFSPVSASILTRAGSLEERIALSALRRCLRANFPAVRRLRILVGGEPAESLGGHLNISRPLDLEDAAPRGEAASRPDPGEE